MLLIRQAAVYAPEYLGIKDVLICSNKIEAIEDHIDGEIPFCKVVDGHGKKLTPGFLDPHIHITGGGGEGSFHTQVPAVSCRSCSKAALPLWSACWERTD